MTTIRILLRRWYVVILGAALTAAAANAVMASVAPTYKTTGSVLIVAPSPVRVEGREIDALSLNPFTRFSAATTVLANVTVQIMDNTEVRERLGARGGVRDYEIGTGGDQLPIVYVTVVDEDEELAIRANSLLLASINEELDRRQAAAGAPAESRIRSLVITEPTKGTELVGGRVRAVLAVAVIGMAASLSTAFVVEGFAQARRKRRATTRRSTSDSTYRGNEVQVVEPEATDEALERHGVDEAVNSAAGSKRKRRNRTRRTTVDTDPAPNLGPASKHDGVDGAGEHVVVEEEVEDLAQRPPKARTRGRAPRHDAAVQRTKRPVVEQVGVDDEVEPTDHHSRPS